MEATVLTETQRQASLPESLSEEELKKAVAHELQVRIRSWMEDSKGAKRTPSTLALKTGVSGSTIRRLINFGTIPSSDNLMRILTVLVGSKTNTETIEYFGKNSGTVFYYLKKYTTLASDFYRGAVLSGLQAPALPNDQNLYIAFVLMLNRKRVSLVDIVEKMGEAGKSAVKRLIELGFAEVNSQGLLIPNNEKVIFSKERGLFLAKYLIERFSTGEGNKSLLDLQTETVSLAGLEKLRKLSTEFATKVEETIAENEGSIPVFAVSLVDTMTFESESAQGSDGGSNEQ